MRGGGEGGWGQGVELDGRMGGGDRRVSGPIYFIRCDSIRSARVM